MLVEIGFVTMPPRVVVIGDLHGCCESTVAAFRLAVQDAHGHDSTIKYRGPLQHLLFPVNYSFSIQIMNPADKHDMTNCSHAYVFDHLPHVYDLLVYNCFVVLLCGVLMCNSSIMLWEPCALD